MELEHRIDALETEISQHRESFNRLIELSEANQRQLGQLIEETRGLLCLYRDFQSVGRVGVRIQNFLAWVAKWPLIGGGVYLVLDYLIRAWKV